jgi:hypothetical protein
VSSGARSLSPEYQAGIDLITRKSIAGESLAAHLSTTLEKPEF